MNNINLKPTSRTATAWPNINHALIRAPRHTLIALILVAALLAFEVFNFDTTKFALNDLLGHISFLGISWAAILAFAFCAIDFAGLVRIFTPEQGNKEPKEVWYLMGAWLLGATMNAIMTWYAVSLTLLQRPLHTSEVLTQEQLMTVVPVFVAVLVWLTRILFIGSLSMAGEQVFAAARADVGQETQKQRTVRQPAARPPQARVNRPHNPAPMRAAPVREPSRENVAPTRPTNSRVRQRPPLAGGPTARPVAPMSARPKSQR
jgi:hypothetical protein